MRPFLLSTTPLLGRAFSGWPPLEKPKALGFPIGEGDDVSTRRTVFPSVTVLYEGLGSQHYRITT
jgi:hypothetical protein